MNNSFMTLDELREIGFRDFHPSVQVSRKASFYGAENIVLGEGARIDDFAIVSARRPVTLHGNNHISAGALLYGRGGLVLYDGAHVAPGAILMSESENYARIDQPLVIAPIIMGAMSVAGARSFVFPGVDFEVGAVLAVNSSAKETLGAWEIWAGNPARFVKRRV